MVAAKIKLVAQALGFLCLGLLALYGGLALISSPPALAAGHAAVAALPGSAPSLDGGGASVPLLMNYQGYLRDAEGAPLSGSYTMTLRIYAGVADPVEGRLWEDQFTDVTVRDGLFSVLLGNTRPLPTALFSSPDRFIGVTVYPYDEMTPRQRLASVPYAFQADQALGVPAGSVTTAQLADGAVTSSKLNPDSGLAVTGDLSATGDLSTAYGFQTRREGSFSGTGDYGFYELGDSFIGIVTVSAIYADNCCYSSIHQYLVLGQETGSGIIAAQEVGSGLWSGFDGMQRVNAALKPLANGFSVHVDTSTSSGAGTYSVSFTVFNGALTSP